MWSCAALSFEEARPVGQFRWLRGARDSAGWYWAAMVGRHVGSEPWLERGRLILPDFDPQVVGTASQPFWLFWHDGVRERCHAPDYFVRRDDGSAVVVDVRDDIRIGPRNADVFLTTRRARQRVGGSPGASSAWERRRRS
ncbi:TnsA-like heteromeric transposase endonuclease subunit [Embleya sp. NPDC050493]|uniref:TnsA-like heteromeric transposase endonuclease subunit n=1 Tax=Embleya sp. NPDC050493 TaxID=3363989 RepID=UPI0037984B9D